MSRALIKIKPFRSKLAPLAMAFIAALGFVMGVPLAVPLVAPPAAPMSAAPKALPSVPPPKAGPFQPAESPGAASMLAAGGVLMALGFMGRKRRVEKAFGRR